jgi:hypothetical protein
MGARPKSWSWPHFETQLYNIRTFKQSQVNKIKSSLSCRSPKGEVAPRIFQCVFHVRLESYNIQKSNSQKP